MKKQLIIVSGLSCTGKSTLAKEIGKKFNLPVFSKDKFKESLFDSLGYSDREFSKKLGVAAYKLLYEQIEEMLAAGVSLIVEANFKAEYDSLIFKEIITKHNPHVIQLICRADGDVLFNRFKERSESGERHPGHVDHKNYDEFAPILRSGEYRPLDIPGDILDIDTTDFSKIDYPKIFKTVEGS